MSIQSQILCDVPYANEPSFEAICARPEGKRAVAKHNATIRVATLRTGMYGQLTTPTLGFERAIKAHFFYKREEIKAQIEGESAWTSKGLRACASSQTSRRALNPPVHESSAPPAFPFREQSGPRTPATWPSTRSTSSAVSRRPSASRLPS
jgi:hypothetical protein